MGWGCQGLLLPLGRVLSGDVSAAWCRAELVELGAALPAAAAPACSILRWHHSHLPVAKGVSCALLFPSPIKPGREPFGDSRKNRGKRRREGIMRVLQGRGQPGHQHALKGSGSDQLIPSRLVSDVGIESKAASWI